MSPGITKNAEESIENILFELEIFRGRIVHCSQRKF